MAPRELDLKRTGDGGLPHFWRGRLVHPNDLDARGFDRPELRSSLLVQLVCRGEDGNFEPLSSNLGLGGRQRCFQFGRGRRRIRRGSGRGQRGWQWRGRRHSWLGGQRVRQQACQRPVRQEVPRSCARRTSGGYAAEHGAACADLDGNNFDQCRPDTGRAVRNTCGVEARDPQAQGRFQGIQLSVRR